MQERLHLSLDTESLVEGQKLIPDLIDKIVETSEDARPIRVKENPDTMDLGATLSLIVTSAAATALAHGIALWLARHKTATLKISTNAGDEIVATGLTSKDATKLAGLFLDHAS